jgi:hypothetical protein
MKEFALILRPPNYQNDDIIENIVINSNGLKSDIAAQLSTYHPKKAE